MHLGDSPQLCATGVLVMLGSTFRQNYLDARRLGEVIREKRLPLVGRVGIAEGA